ncbi:MAG TPA: hypothetical protein VFQ53_38370 [Kofleriaceae bacterium]|nr:hypothetical protein [Kofleriaceae bacterium]
MPVLRAWPLAIVLVACSTAPPPSPITHHVPVPAACIAHAARNGSIKRFSAHDGVATLCYGDPEGYEDEKPPSCIVVDRRGNVVRDARWTGWGLGGYQPPYELTFDAGTYTVCETAGAHHCRSFRTSHPKHEWLNTAGDVSDDGKLAFVLEERGNEIVGELYDVDTGRQLAQSQVSNLLGPDGPGISDRSITRVSGFYGTNVIVGEWPAGPGGACELLDPFRGKAVYLHGYGGTTQTLDDHSLLVLDGHELSIIHVDTLAKSAPRIVPGAPFDNPEASSSDLVMLDDAVLIAYAQPAGIIIFDRTTRTLGAPHALPICPD